MDTQTKDKWLLYRTLLQNVYDIKKDDNSEDDKKFRKNTKNQITKRDGDYSSLLSHFVFITQIRNYLKEFFKWLFYLVVVGSVGTLTIVVFSLFKRYMGEASIEQITEGLPLLITAMVGFVSTIIAIPVTITKYLFSTKEDENITQIILHTQDHDTSGRRWAMDFKEMAENLKRNEKSVGASDVGNLNANILSEFENKGTYK